MLQRLSVASTIHAPESIGQRLSVVDKDIKPGTFPEFTIVTYNCLVDWHAQDDYGSRVDPQYLSSDFRHERILEELEYLNGDVACLQEVTPDFYNKTLKDWFTDRKFHCNYVQRTCGRTDEGVAVFYRKDKFLCKRVEPVQFKNAFEEPNKTFPLLADRYKTIQNGFIVELELTGTPHVVVVATTHLLFGDFVQPDVQVFQISAMKHILKERYGAAPVILCGDFNSYPDTPQYHFATNGTLSDEQWTTLQEKSSIHEQGELFKVFREFIEDYDSRSRYLSAYKTVMGREPEVTCVDHVFRCCLDYVLYQDAASVDPVDKDGSNPSGYKLVPVSVLDTMPLKEVEKAVPPSHIYPSNTFHFL